MTIGLGRRHPRLRHDVEVGRNGSPTSHAGRFQNETRFTPINTHDIELYMALCLDHCIYNTIYATKLLI